MLMAPLALSLTRGNKTSKSNSASQLCSNCSSVLESVTVMKYANVAVLTHMQAHGCRLLVNMKRIDEDLQLQ